MGPAGAGALAQIVNAAMNSTQRFKTMQDFFEGVGQGDTAGVWEDTPRDLSGLRKKAKPAKPKGDGIATDGAIGC